MRRVQSEARTDGEGLKLVTVPLSQTRLAPLDHRLREIDESFVALLSASFKETGSQQITEFLGYKSNGFYNICGGSHVWSAFRASHDDSAEVRVLDLETNKEDEIILWLLRSDNHHALGPDLWRKHLLRLRSKYPSQLAMATAVGLTPGYVSELLNGDPKARREAEKKARAEAKSLRANYTETYISTKASLPPNDLGGMGTLVEGLPLPSPNGGDDGARVLPSGIGSLGETGRSPLGERGSGSVVLRPETAVPKSSIIQPIQAPQPPLSSHLDALESAAEPLLKRSVWLKATDASFQRMRLETLYWRLGDLLMSLEYDTWNGETPKGRAKTPLPTFREGDTVSVETHGKSLILKVLEDGRFRIKDAHGDVQVVSGRMVLAAERARA